MRDYAADHRIVLDRFREDDCEELHIAQLEIASKADERRIGIRRMTERSAQ